MTGPLLTRRLCSFSTSGTGVYLCEDGCSGSGEAGHPPGSCAGPHLVKKHLPQALYPASEGLSLAAAPLVPAEQAALPPACMRRTQMSCPREDGELAHGIVLLASPIIGEDTRLEHPQAYSWVGTANTANSWKKKK